MRREQFRMPRAEALELLSRANVIHLATTDEAGSPILRTVHGVVVDGHVAFHGAPAGEKMLALGREVVLSAEETVAAIPSYFTDPERACPATTLYRSVMVHGVLTKVDDPRTKERVLSALMQKLQPEGGYVPLDVDDPLYKRAIEGILIVWISTEEMDGKSKLLQHKKPEERRHLLEQLWKRGAPGDVRAIDTILAASPDTPTPDFLRAPEGVRLHCALDESSAGEATALLHDAYWNAPHRPERIAEAHLGSTAWVGARDSNGKLVATARAIADGAKFAWIYDVMVAAEWRGKALGRAVLRLLLDHPAVRGAWKVLLGTKDAQGFYRSFGFVEEHELPKKSYTSTTMVLPRAPG